MGSVQPTLSFLIPSLHDGTQLECRVYHPSTRPSIQSKSSNAAAILAHPYAPLGGCYDVPVVLEVSDTLLREGVTVCTFNFRGAGSSKGRTSWTGKSEVNDYESVTVFMLLYLSLLDEELAKLDSRDESDTSAVASRQPVVNLVLAGYSYGSLVAMHLPAINDILSDSIYLPPAQYLKDILSTAQSLASQAAKDLSTRHQRSSHIRVGSHERSVSRCSIDGRRAHEVFKNVMHPNRSKSSNALDSEGVKHLPLPKLPRIEPHYLFISPIQPPLSLAVMIPLGQGRASSPAWETSPTLAVFGDRDGFSSLKKLTPWAQTLANKQGSSFQYVAVAGAGHFWMENGAAEKMKGAIRDWVRAVVLVTEGD